MNDQSQAQAKRPAITDERPFWVRINNNKRPPSARTARRAAAKIARQYRKVQR